MSEYIATSVFTLMQVYRLAASYHDAPATVLHCVYDRVLVTSDLSKRSLA